MTKFVNEGQAKNRDLSPVRYLIQTILSYTELRTACTATPLYTGSAHSTVIYSYM